MPAEGRGRSRVHMYIFYLFLFLATVSEARPSGQSTVHETITLTGRIDGMLIRDVNGDGLADIICGLSTSIPGQFRTARSLAVFIQEEDGFSSSDPVTLDLQNEDLFWDCAELEGDGEAEIVFLRREGFRVLKWDGASVQPAFSLHLEDHSLFPLLVPRTAERRPFLQDLTPAPGSELVFPQHSGMTVIGRRGDEYVLLARLVHFFSLQSESEEQSVSFPLPRLLQIRFNLDDSPDWALVSGSSLDIFLRQKDPGVDTEIPLPPDFSYRFGGRSLEESPLEPLAPRRAGIEVADMNGDSLSDIVLTRAGRARFLSAPSQLQIFYNKGGYFTAVPDVILTSENFNGEHLLRDFNGDGLMDAALLSFPAGFVQAARYLLCGKVENSFDLYPQQEGGLFPNRPQRRLLFRRRLKIEHFLPDPPHSSLSGDWNSDGRPDLFIFTDTDLATLFPGDRAGFFSRKERWDIQIPAGGLPLIADLDGDRRPDLVVWTRGSLRGEAHILILRNDGSKDQ